MDTKDGSFLKILKEYFSQKSPEDLEREDNGDIILDTQWFYGETQDTQINGEKFEEYLAKALCRLRRTTEKNGNIHYGYYDKVVQEALDNAEAAAICHNGEKRKLTFRERYLIEKDLEEKLNSKIGKIALRLFDKNGNVLDNAKLIITGIDGETIQEICEEPQGRSYQSSEEELYRAILRGLSAEDKMSLDLEAFALPTIRENMIDMANKFVQYYEYLLNEKKKSEKNDIVEIALQQDTSVGGKSESPTKVNVLNTKSERKNDLIDYPEREKILEDVGLQQVAKIVSTDLDSGCKNNECIMFTKQIAGVSGIEDGLLVWLEPIEGEHYSRIAFCTQERIDKIISETGKTNVTQALATYFYSKSHSDFIKEANVATLAHTSIETFERMVDVLASQNKKTNQGLYKKDTNEHQRQRKREKLFGIGEFRKLVETVAQEEFEKAEGALSTILTPEIGPDEKNKGGE